jgi:Tfp pilus assembly protein PilX
MGPRKIEEKRQVMTQAKKAVTARGESGFALVLAILSLMLLTFLGLTMATTTSTELQIATNYRWSQQALYNAEAGIELGKRYLRQIEWQTVLPPARTGGFASYGGYAGGNCAQGQGGHCPTPFLTRAQRSFENYACDQSATVAAAAGFQGYGTVLDDVNFAVPFENVSTFLGQSLKGSFTIWVRRPYVISPPPADPPFLEDDSRNDRLVLTAEGIAPYIGNLSDTSTSQAGISAAFGRRNRAMRIMEVTLQRIAPGDCENRTSQTGSGPLGAGFDQCDPIRQQGILGGVTAIGGVQ